MILDFAAWWMEANNKQRASAGGRPLTSPFSPVRGCTSLRVKLIIRLLILVGLPKRKDLPFSFRGKMCHWAAPNTPVDEWCTWSGWQPPRQPIQLNEDVNFPSKWATVFPLRSQEDFPPKRRHHRKPAIRSFFKKLIAINWPHCGLHFCYQSTDHALLYKSSIGFVSIRRSVEPQIDNFSRRHLLAFCALSVIFVNF